MNSLLQLLKDEERLAMEEEEHYAQKTSQIREFYQNRPPTTVSFYLAFLCSFDPIYSLILKIQKNIVI